MLFYWINNRINFYRIGVWNHSVPTRLVAGSVLQTWKAFKFSIVCQRLTHFENFSTTKMRQMVVWHGSLYDGVLYKVEYIYSNLQSRSLWFNASWYIECLISESHASFKGSDMSMTKTIFLSLLNLNHPKLFNAVLFNLKGKKFHLCINKLNYFSKKKAKSSFVRPCA